MLMLLSHVIVYVSDMQRSIRFYRDQLGFPVKSESPEWTEFHTGTTTLALHHAQPGEQSRGGHGETRAGEAQFGIEVLDLDKFYEEKKAVGIQFVMAPTMRPSGVTGKRSPYPTVVMVTNAHQKASPPLLMFDPAADGSMLATNRLPTVRTTSEVRTMTYRAASERRRTN